MKYWRRPLDLDKVIIPHGRVYIIEDRCKGCGFCIEYCPKHVLVVSDRFNRKGYHPPEVVKAEECVNCNLCETICPDFAIFNEAINENGTAEKGAAQAEVKAAPGEAAR